MSIQKTNSIFSLALGTLISVTMHFPLSAVAEEPPSPAEMTRPSPQDPEAWWAFAQAELFEGIELSESQQEQIALLMVQADEDRSNFSKAEEQLGKARREGNAGRIQVLSATVIEYRQSLRPDSRMDKMRDLLEEDQVQRFNKNRRLRGDRELAHKLSRRKSRPQQGGGSNAQNSAGNSAAESP